MLEKLILFPFMKKKKPFKTTHYLLWNYRAVGKLNILGVINNQRLFEKQCFALNVAVEVLFIEISLNTQNVRNPTIVSPVKMEYG